MIDITINGKEIHAVEGMTIYQAAQDSGIDIPVMCYHPEAGHFASCMICVVKEKKSNKLLTSCSVKVSGGMDIITDDEEIAEARKTTLELLLSEHTGDCEAPCQFACPAHMNIPLMNRLLADGKIDEALGVIKKDIPIPSVLGRICPAPCEGVCRRRTVDSAVPICHLKRYAGDFGKNNLIKPVTSGKKVAIIGAGPAGLSAAYYLQQNGIQAVVFDKNELPGGELRYAIPDEKLDKKILDLEIQHIETSGVQFRLKNKINADAFEQIRKDFDAVIIATGNFSGELSAWGLEHKDNQLIHNKKTLETGIPGIFAAGNITRSTRLAVRSVGQGKGAAISVDQFLAGRFITGETGMFSSRFGKLLPEEFSEYLKESENKSNTGKDKKTLSELTSEEVIQEAKRCMHCDCRKIDTCKLRIYSDAYRVVPKRFDYEERKPVRKLFNHDTIVYEPEKCIKCGICVRITAKYEEKYGFTYIGRGFDVEIGIPFSEELKEGISKTGKEVAEACPTGALALKHEPARSSDQGHEEPC